MDDEPLNPGVRKPAFMIRAFLWIAAMQPEILRRCPNQDTDHGTSLALLLISVWGYQAAVLSGIAHTLLGRDGQIHAGLVVGSMFIATLILLLDRFVFLHAGFYADGNRELARGGLNLGGGLAAKLKSVFFSCIRLVLAMTFAQLTALFMGLIIFSADVNADNDNRFQQRNAVVIARETLRFDGEFQRATDAVIAKSKQVADLSAQVTAVRQGQVDLGSNDPQMQEAQREVSQLTDRQAKADEEVMAAESHATAEAGGAKSAGNSGQPGYGVRYRAAMEQVTHAQAYAQKIATELSAARGRLDSLRNQLPSANAASKQRSDDQLPAFEQALAAENARLLSMKAELAELTQGRNTMIRSAVEGSPDYVGRDDGLLAQLAALRRIAQDREIAAVILLIDLASFGLEMAAVIAKLTAYVPTTYAALLARDAYMRAVRIVDDMTAELDGPRANKDTPETPKPHEPPNDNPPNGGAPAGMNPFANDNDPPQPPKRKRGRPRKPRPGNGLAKDANGQEDPEPK